MLWVNYININEIYLTVIMLLVGHTTKGSVNKKDNGSRPFGNFNIM